MFNDLAQDLLKELLDYDPETGVFTWKVSRKGIRKDRVAGCLNNRGYLHIVVNSRPYKAHRLAWIYVYGCWPENEIDHINHDKSDNRIINLREATRKINCKNQSLYRNNSSGVTGLVWNSRKNKWRVHIGHNGKLIHGGDFLNKKDAITRRNQLQK